VESLLNGVGNRPLRILYLVQFFEPEPMIKGASFVRALAAAGHHVEVVTGFPNYPVGKLYPGYRLSLHKAEIVEGVPVHRVPLYPSHGTSSLGRILNYFSFVASVTVYGIFFARKFDVIYAYPPPTVALAATVIGAIRRRPFILDVQDLWPDSVLKSGMAGTGRMAGVLSAMCRLLYRRATRILVQSRGIAATIVERGADPAKIDVVYNWADEDAARARGELDVATLVPADRFNIVYGGNLGRVQGLDTLVRAAHRAQREVPSLRLLLIGNGTEGANLRALVADLGATNVDIHSGVPRTQIGDVFAAADVLALHLLDDPLFEITIPQKTQFYMAMSKPVLIGVRGEAASFVEAARAGIVVPPGDVEAIATTMVAFARMSPDERSAMGRRGLEAYRRDFSFASAIAATQATMARAVTRG
jgi:colanic acid biosynthesis glycosyl transferase WcaI